MRKEGTSLACSHGADPTWSPCQETQHISAYIIILDLTYLPTFLPGVPLLLLNDHVWTTRAFIQCCAIKLTQQKKRSISFIHTWTIPMKWDCWTLSVEEEHQRKAYWRDGCPINRGVKEQKKYPTGRSQDLTFFKVDHLYWCKDAERVISKGIPERPHEADEVVH